MQARVRNIAFINDRVANVRFTRTVQTETDVQNSDWIATITFAYANAPMAEGDRYRTAGIRVENYRADPEVIR
jgi:type IV secretion system protein VirB8